MPKGLYCFARVAVLLGLTICEGQSPNDQSVDNAGPIVNEDGRRSGLDPELHRAYVNAYENENSQATTAAPPTPTPIITEWESLTPRRPSPHEVDCYVEIPLTLRRGGRCTRLGGVNNDFICQSGPHILITPNCEGIIAARDNQEPRASPQAERP